MAGPMIARLAGHYGCQIRPEQGKQGFRLPCPAHRGDDANCHVFESDGGRIAAKCFSRGCEPSEILSAIERDTGMVRINPPGHSFQATYHRAGQPVDVWRIDEGGNKRYPTPGSRQAVPVELWGDEQAETVIVCEGEKAARAIQRAGYTAASYMGGAGCAGLADYTKLRGRTAYIWPDNDLPGLRAGRDAAKAAHLSGAGVWMLSPVGKPESGDDAADVDDLPAVIAGLMATATEFHQDGLSQPPERQVVRDGPTVAGLRHCLQQLGIAYRWNIRRSCIEFDDGNGWREENDRHSAGLRERIRTTFNSPKPNNPGLQFTRDQFTDHLNGIVEDAETDPFEVWLQDLLEWDGQGRLDGLLHACFNIADDQNPPELVIWASRFPVMGAVWRTLHPGAKLDEMPVLVGAQGIGKSTLLRLLLPDDAHNWFSDGLTLTATDREVAETLAGRVIVEVSEMVGLRRAEIGRLKTVLSRTDDGYHRGAYARHAETRLRRCVIVGTTNSSECLPNDERGNRRFVVVEIAAGRPGKVRQYLDANRDQLWAEGLARCRAGEHPRLPDKYKGIQATHNERHRAADDTLEAEIDQWLQDGPKEFTLGDCAAGIGMVDAAARLDPSGQKRLGKALRSLGYEKRNCKREGRQVKLWRKVERLPVALVAPIS